MGGAPLPAQAPPDVPGGAGRWGVPSWGMNAAVPSSSYPFAPAAHYSAQSSELPVWRSMSSAGAEASAVGRARGAARLLEGLLRGAAAAAVLPMPSQAAGGDAPEAAGLLEDASVSAGAEESKGAKVAPSTEEPSHEATGAEGWGWG